MYGFQEIVPRKPTIIFTTNACLYTTPGINRPRLYLPFPPELFFGDECGTLIVVAYHQVFCAIIHRYREAAKRENKRKKK